MKVATALTNLPMATLTGAFPFLVQAEFIHQVTAGILQFAHHVGDDFEQLVVWASCRTEASLPGNGAKSCLQLKHRRPV